MVNEKLINGEVKISEMSDSKKLEQILKNQIKSHDVLLGSFSSRPGLYIMVSLTMISSIIGSCTGPSDSDVEKVRKGNYQICLNQQQLQEQQADLYNAITGNDYFSVDYSPNFSVQKIDCSEYEFE